MTVTGAALSHNGVIIAVLFHDMGTFGATLAGAFPCSLRRTRHRQSVRRQGNCLCCLGNDHISAARHHPQTGMADIRHGIPGLTMGQLHYQTPSASCLSALRVWRLACRVGGAKLHENVVVFPVPACQYAVPQVPSGEVQYALVSSHSGIRDGMHDDMP